MGPLSRAEITLLSDRIDIFLGNEPVKLGIICRGPDRQSSSMALVCSQPSPHLSHIGLLIIQEENDEQQRWGNSIDPTLWLETF